MPAIIDYTTSQVDTNVTSIAVVLPFEYAVGDLLLVFGSKDYSTGGALTCATSGWVEIQQANYLTSGMLTTRVALFAKEATSTSETPPVIASTNAATWTGLSISIRGWHDTGTLSDVISAVAGYSTTTYPFTASSITTLHDDCLVLYAMASSSVKASVPIADAGTMWITSIASAANALAAGNVPKGGGKYTPRYTLLLDGTKVVIPNGVARVRVQGELLTDDQTDQFDVSHITNAVLILYQPSEAEVIKVNVAEPSEFILTSEQRQLIATEVWSHTR